MIKKHPFNYKIKRKIFNQVIFNNFKNNKKAKKVVQAMDQILLKKFLLIFMKA
jgi:rRNA maturation protein Rpf1